jgi:hypothetical protein
MYLILESMQDYDESYTKPLFLVKTKEEAEKAVVLFRKQLDWLKDRERKLNKFKASWVEENPKPKPIAFAFPYGDIDNRKETEEETKLRKEHKVWHLNQRLAVEAFLDLFEMPEEFKLINEYTFPNDWFSVIYYEYAEVEIESL